MTHRPSRRALAEAALVSLIALTYSNGLTLWALRRSRDPEQLFRRANRLGLVLLGLYSAARRGGLRAVGLRRDGLGKSALWGALVGTLLSGPPILFFMRPFLLDTPLEYGPIARMSRREMLWDIFVRLPVGIALMEELAHRGLLHSALEEALGEKAALIGSAATFAGWHFMVTSASAAESNLSDAAHLPRFLRPYVQPMAVAGGMLTTGVAGLIFGLLRARTGNLAGAIVAHWLVDAIMIAVLWARSGVKPEEAGVKRET